MLVIIEDDVVLLLTGLSEKNYYLDHKEPEGSLYGPEAYFFLDGNVSI